MYESYYFCEYERIFPFVSVVTFLLYCLLPLRVFKAVICGSLYASIWICWLFFNLNMQANIYLYTYRQMYIERSKCSCLCAPRKLLLSSNKPVCARILIILSDKSYLTSRTIQDVFFAVYVHVTCADLWQGPLFSYNTDVMSHMPQGGHVSTTKRLD